MKKLTTKKLIILSLGAGLAIVIISLLFPHTTTYTPSCWGDPRYDCAGPTSIEKRGLPLAVIAAGPYTQGPYILSGEPYTKMTSYSLLFGPSGSSEEVIRALNIQADTIMYPLGFLVNLLLWAGAIVAIGKVLQRNKVKK